jgi:hypothetical protein
LLNAVSALGARRRLFGADGPYMREDLGQAIRAVQDLPLPAQDKEGIPGGSFLKLRGQ